MVLGGGGAIVLQLARDVLAGGRRAIDTQQSHGQRGHSAAQ